MKWDSDYVALAAVALVIALGAGVASWLVQGSLVTAALVAAVVLGLLIGLQVVLALPILLMVGAAWIVDRLDSWFRGGPRPRGSSFNSPGAYDSYMQDLYDGS